MKEINLFKNKKSSFKDKELSNEEINLIKREISLYETPRSACIEALKIVQKRRGWVSDNLIVTISKILGISTSEVEEVATFYSSIFRRSVGKYIIKYCDSIVCYITGCKTIQNAIENILKIKPGKTTPDEKFTLIPTCCLGNCSKSPLIIINEDTYTNLKSEDISLILEKYT